MKKTLFILLTSLLLSCSSENATPTIQEATIRLGFKTSPPINKAGKTVKRGILPIELGTINVHSQLAGSLPVLHTFDIVPDATVGAEDGFIISNVQTGLTTFSADAKSSNSNQNYCLVEKQTSVSEGFKALSERIPYVLYEGKSTSQITVVAGTNDPITFELVPLQGRIIMLFQLEQAMIDLKYTYKILSPSLSYGNTMSFNSNEVGSVYISSTYTGVNTLWAGSNTISSVLYEIYDDKGVRVSAGTLSSTIVNGVSVDTVWTFTMALIPVATATQSIFNVPAFNHVEPTPTIVP